MTVAAAGVEQPTEAPPSPFKGLVPYSEEDWRFFFGRERERQIITANLRTSRLTVLYGASGTGKSSVLRAAVVHELREQARRNLAAHGTAEHAVVMFSSWRDPVGGLIRAVEEEASKLATEADGRPYDPGSLTDALRYWGERVGGDLLIILDQFEEFFLYHGGDAAPGSFHEQLVAAVSDFAVPANFLISIREDAYARLDAFEGEIPRIFENFIRIEHLDPDAAREAIQRPIDRWNELFEPDPPVAVDDRLADEILEQVRAGKVVVGQRGTGAVEETDPAAPLEPRIETPYLQLVLDRLWREEMARGSNKLRVETLNDTLGGAQRIVETYLDERMQALSRAEQDAAAKLFQRLVTKSGTKIAYTIPDLAEQTELPEEAVRNVAEKLSGSARILREVDPPPGDKSGVRYEIYHDVLAAAVLDWRTRYRHEREREEAEREAVGRARQARRKIITYALLTILALITLAVGAVAYLALQERSEARSDRLAAQARESLANDPHASVRLALEAVRERRTGRAEATLREALAISRLRAILRPGGTVSATAFSDDGRTIVWAAGSRVQLIDASTRKIRELVRLEGEVAAVAVTADGGTVVTADDTEAVRFWDARRGREIASRTHPLGVVSAAFSPDGALVVTTGWDGVARIWDAATGAPLRSLRGHASSIERVDYRGFEDYQVVSSAAWSPSGDRLVTAGYDGTARVWFRGRSGWKASARKPQILRGHTNWVVDAEFSSDGTRIVTASDDHTARIWNLRTGKSVVLGHSAAVATARFGPDGTVAATVAGKDLRLSDAQTGRVLRSTRASSDWVWASEFSPDGALLATAGAEGVARIWNVATGTVAFELRGHTDAIESAAFTAQGGRTLATASTDGTLRIWDVSTGREFHGHTGWVHGAALSPDERTLLTASADHRVIKWDARTRELLATLTNRNEKTLNAIAYDPDGARFVTGGDDATAVIRSASDGERLVTLESYDSETETRGPLSPIVDGLAIVWNAQTGKAVFTPDIFSDEAFTAAHDEAATGVAFAPDGRLLVSTGSDGVARVWDTVSKRLVSTLRGHDGSVSSPVVHPEGGYVATASEDWTVRIWDIRKGTEVARLDGTGPLRAAAFSRDGRYVVGAGSEGVTRVWEWEEQKLVAVLRMHADLINSVAFTRDNQILSTSDDRTAKIYPCSTCASLDDLIAIAEGRLAAAG